MIFCLSTIPIDTQQSLYIGFYENFKNQTILHVFIFYSKSYVSLGLHQMCAGALLKFGVKEILEDQVKLTHTFRLLFLPLVYWATRGKFRICYLLRTSYS